MKTVLKQSAFVAVTIFAVVTLSGCSNNKENGEVGVIKSADEVKPPTEKEAVNALKNFYDTCISVNEWKEREREIPYAKQCQERVDICGSDEYKKAEAVDSAKRKQEYEDWLNWSKENKDNQCNSFRINRDDHFVSFKKTEGQFAGFYDMEGVLTMFNSVTSINEEHKIDVSFELKESGWVYTGHF